MSKPSLYRVEKDEQVEWLHVSRSAKIIKVRHYLPDFLEDPPYRLPDQQDDVDELLRGAKQYSMASIAAMTEDALDVSADSIKWDEKEKWQSIIRRLKEIDGVPTQSTQSTPPAKGMGSRCKDRIPQTRLRRLYQTFRILNNTAIHGHIADYFISSDGIADRIQHLFKESADHFAQYANPEEPFHPRRRDQSDWFQNYLNEPKHFAHCLTARFKPFDGKWLKVSGKCEFCLRAVDYEISPFRTTGGRFEDGKRGSVSGGGGLDLLLQSKDGFPVIGEIKAKKDTNLFMALIQALTYAVELTTLAQAERLKRTYPNDFSNLSYGGTGCQCDVVLIHDHLDCPKLLEQAKKLASRLLSVPGSPVSEKVRRIAVVSAELHKEVHEDGGVRLSCTFSCDQK